MTERPAPPSHCSLRKQIPRVSIIPSLPLQDHYLSPGQEEVILKPFVCFVLFVVHDFPVPEHSWALLWGCRFTGTPLRCVEESLRNPSTHCSEGASFPSSWAPRSRVARPKQKLTMDILISSTTSASPSPDAERLWCYGSGVSKDTKTV